MRRDERRDDEQAEFPSVSELSVNVVPLATGVEVFADGPLDPSESLVGLFDVVFGLDLVEEEKRRLLIGPDGAKAKRSAEKERRTLSKACLANPCFSVLSAIDLPVALVRSFARSLALDEQFRSIDGNRRRKKSDLFLLVSLLSYRKTKSALLCLTFTHLPRFSSSHILSPSLPPFLFLRLGTRSKVVRWSPVVSSTVFSPSPSLSFCDTFRFRRTRRKKERKTNRILLSPPQSDILHLRL